MITKEQIEQYVAEVQEAVKKEWIRNEFRMENLPVITYKKGKVYFKLFRESYGSKSVHCFVDSEGNLFKAAGWNQPAKGIRGNILNEKKPLLGGQFYR